MLFTSQDLSIDILHFIYLLSLNKILESGWHTQGATNNTGFPEGTAWLHVADNVKQVTAGDREDMWAVLDNYKGVGGVIARRRGVSPASPGGDDWEICVGGGWKHLCIRGWTK